VWRQPEEAWSPWRRQLNSNFSRYRLSTNRADNDGPAAGPKLTGRRLDENDQVLLLGNESGPTIPHYYLFGSVLPRETQPFRRQ